MSLVPLTELRLAMMSEPITVEQLMMVRAFDNRCLMLVKLGLSHDNGIDILVARLLMITD
jgi:hypothetical protein